MFRVEWLQSALNQLAEAWGQADSELRQAITAATDLLDRQLVVAPDVYGESRGGTAASILSLRSRSSSLLPAISASSPS